MISFRNETKGVLAALAGLGLALPATPTFGDDAPENAWPGFRGEGNSVSQHTDLPLTWSETENLAWRVPLSGFGQSSPVIAAGNVYVTSTSGDHKETLILESFDLAAGKPVWKKEFAASQTAAEVSEMISRGAPTPAADAGGVYAFFESGDLFALDHDGTIRWQRHLTKEYGEFQGGHGIGSSVVNAPDSIVLLIDHDGPSYLLCLDKKTGENLWKTEREPRVSWTTPLLIEHDGSRKIVVSSNGAIEAFDIGTGERIWSVEGIEGNTVASPTVAGDRIVIGSSAPKYSLAVRLGGSGNVTESHIAWRADSVTSSFGSPLVHNDTAYFVNRAGALQATNLTDGSLRFEMRLPGSCWASPLASGERLYFFCKNGETAVLQPKDTGAETLATNALPVSEKDRVYGYAVASGQFVIRTSRELFCVGELPQP